MKVGQVKMKKKKGHQFCLEASVKGMYKSLCVLFVLADLY